MNKEFRYNVIRKKREDFYMDYLNYNIAINLKKIRLSKNMSLDNVSEQTGVSKSMLAQIEKGGANPTIGILGKIVSGLRVEFDELIGEPSLDSYYMERENLVPSKQVLGKYEVYTCFPTDTKRKYEVYYIDIESGMEYVSGSHGEHTSEFISVTKGELMIQTREKEFIIRERDVFRFNTNTNHIYKNQTKEPISLIVFFIFDK